MLSISVSISVSIIINNSNSNSNSNSNRNSISISISISIGVSGSYSVSGSAMRDVVSLLASRPASGFPYRGPSAVIPLSRKEWRKDQKVAEDGGNDGGSSLCAHHPRRVVGS